MRPSNASNRRGCGQRREPAAIFRTGAAAGVSRARVITGVGQWGVGRGEQKWPADTLRSMRFVSRHGEPITTLDEWRTLGRPAAEHHWQEGRSALELAQDWIARDAVQRVAALLALQPAFAGLELIEGVAEKQTQFDDISRGKRNHDLLVRATCQAGRVTLGVEGKADESFDKPLWLWRERARKASPDSAAPRRLDQLTKLWFHTTIERDEAHPPLACLGYQLMSALAGTLADAKLDGAELAVLLVHEFVTPKTEDARHRANAQALDNFVLRLVGDAPREGHADAWVTSPVRVAGDGAWSRRDTQVSIAKLVTRLR